MRSEQALIDAAQTYASMIYRIALHQLRSPHDAEDIVQEVLLRYLKSDRAFENPEHEKAWIIRVAVNCCKSLHLSVWRRRVLPTEEMAQTPAVHDPGGRLEMLDALARLPPKYRIVLYLHYYEGYPAAEIGALLGRNKNTVLSHLARGRRLLEQQLEEDT